MYPQTLIKISCIIFILISPLNVYGADKGNILSAENKSGSLGALTLQDTWNFYGEIGDRVLIRTRSISGGLMPEIYLYPPGGGPLEDNATGNSYSHLLDTQLQASGLYTIIVKGWFTQDTGDYGISMTKITGAVTSTIDPDGGDIVSGETKTGNLSILADIDGFQFYGDVGNRVIIQTNSISGGLMPEIYLYPPGGGPLEDNATGNRTSHLLDTQLQASGLYTIIVKGWYTQDTGEYSISLSKIPSALSTGIYNSYPNNTCAAIYSNSSNFFRWDGLDEALSYDLYFGENVTTPLQHTGDSLLEPMMDSPNFECNTIYYWHVVAHGPSRDIEGPYYLFGTTSLPGIATLIPPTYANDDKLLYKWNAGCGASSYRLQVSDLSGAIIDNLISAEDATCSPGVGTCTIIPDETMTTGDYTWRIQSTNCIGDGAWSATETFSLYNVTANVDGNGSGSISSDIGGINFNYPAINTNTSSIMSEGSSITLTATKDTGSTVSWSGCDSTGGTPTVSTCILSSLDSNEIVSATFVNAYLVNTSAPANQGTFTPSFQTVSPGETTAFDVATKSGYTIKTVTGCGGTWTGSNPYVTGSITTDCTVTAVLVRFPWILFNHLLNDSR